MKRKRFPELEAKERAIRDAARLRELEHQGIVCPNCGKSTLGCFVPPSFGDVGFYACEPKKEADNG